MMRHTLLFFAGWALLLGMCPLAGWAQADRARQEPASAAKELTLLQQSTNTAAASPHTPVSLSLQPYFPGGRLYLEPVGTTADWQLRLALSDLLPDFAVVPVQPRQDSLTQKLTKELLTKLQKTTEKRAVDWYTRLKTGGNLRLLSAVDTSTFRNLRQTQAAYLRDSAGYGQKNTAAFATYLSKRRQDLASQLKLPTGTTDPRPVWQELVQYNATVATAGALQADTARLRRVLQLLTGELLAQALPNPTAKSAGNTDGALLYHGQLQLPTLPQRRTVNVFIRDRGESTVARNAPRYAICLNYAAIGDGSTTPFVDPLAPAEPCTPPTGYVGVSVALAKMERTAFVGELSRAIMAKDAQLEQVATRQLADNTQTGQAQAQLLRAQRLFAKAPLPTSTEAVKKAYTTDSTQTAEQLRELLRDFYDLYQRSTATLYATPNAGVILLGERLDVYRDMNEDTISAIKKRLEVATEDVAKKRAEKRKEEKETKKTAEKVQQQQQRAIPQQGPRYMEEKPISLEGFFQNAAETPLEMAEKKVRELTTLLEAAKKMHLNDLFFVDSVQVEVEDGNLMALKAHGRYQGIRVLFESYVPIGISSDGELKGWYNQKLYAQSSDKKSAVERHWQRTASNTQFVEEKGLFIYLDDLLRYHPLLSPQAGDRSPADGVYTFRPQDALSRRILPKTPTAKILQARVYTDLAGIANDRPNGLIQAEINKRIILNGRYHPLRIMPRKLQFALGHYVTPMASVNKIEENNRQLKLNRIDTSSPTTRRVQTIDLLRYTNLQVGVTQNVLMVKAPNIKSDFALDLNVRLGRVTVRDSLAPKVYVDSTLTVLSYGPQLVWRVRPDSRWGFQMRFASVREKLINNSGGTGNQRVNYIQQFPQASDAQLEGKTVVGNLLAGSSQNILQYELLFWTNTSESSQLFFRTQFSHMRHLTSRTFFQLQLGYQFDVFTNRRTAVMPAGLFSK